MFEFRLVYQGLLFGSNNDKTRSDHKHDIRRYLHPQLVNLWNTRQPLKQRLAANVQLSKTSSSFIPAGADVLSSQYKIGNQRFLPLVTSSDMLVCGLDVLLLRRDLGMLISSGDLDNRVKTIVDALRMPKAGENYEAEENPLYVVLEEDQLISEIKITADHLFATPDQLVAHPKISQHTGEPTVRDNHAVAIIHVKVKATQFVPGNLEFM